MLSIRSVKLAKKNYYFSFLIVAELRKLFTCTYFDLDDMIVAIEIWDGQQGSVPSHIDNFHGQWDTFVDDPKLLYEKGYLPSALAGSTSRPILKY